MKGKTWIALAMLVLAVVTVLVYLPALGNGFVNWDDNIYVTENPLIQHLDYAFFKVAFTKHVALNYHPLTLISHAVDYTLWGMNPMGHHLTSVLLHGLNTALVFLLFITLVPLPPGPAWKAKEVWAAGLTALLFGVHPIHTESVVWVAERKDVLYSAFYLLSLLTYIDYVKSGARPIRLYLLSLLCFLLSLMSKPMAVTLPVVLLLLDIYPLKRLHGKRWRDQGMRQVVLEKVPFGMLAAIFSAATIQSQQQAMVHIPLVSRLILVPYSLMEYIFKLIAPVNLAPYYPYPHPLLSRMIIPPVILVASAFAAVVITAVCLWYRRTRPEILLAWAAYVLILLPVLGIIQVGLQLTADRYAYLSSVPVLYLLAVAITAGLKRVPIYFKTGIAVLSLTAFGFLVHSTWAQIPVWKDSLTLWNHELRLFENVSALPYYNRGCAFLLLGANERALQDFNKTIEIDPQHTLAYGNRGYVYMLGKRYADALPDFNRAVELNPTSSTAIGNRGTLLSILGKPWAAIQDLSRALALDPMNYKALQSRGEVYIELRAHRQALVDFSSIIALGAGDVYSYLGRGQAREALGDMAGALTDFSHALGLDPGSFEAHAGLGSVYMKMGLPDKAAIHRAAAGQHESVKNTRGH